MIKVSFIHEYDQYDNIVQYINQQMTDINSLMESESMLDREIEDLELFNESTKEKKEEKKEISKSFVDKVGETIIGLVNKIKKLLEDLRQTIHEKLWNKKTDVQKLQKIVSEYPDLKDQIILAVQKGDLEIKDIKSMDDLTNGTIDLMKKLNMGKIDESEFDKRFNALYDKYKKYGKPAIEVITGVVAVVGAVITVKKFKTDWIKSTEDYQKYSQARNERYATAIQDIIQNHNGNLGQNTISTKLRAWTMVRDADCVNISGMSRLANRLANGIERVSNAVANRSQRVANHINRANNNLAAGANRVLNSADRRRERDLDREYQSSFAKAQGTIAGERSMGVDRAARNKNATP